MKKLFTLLLALASVCGLEAASYGILVNTNQFYVGTKNNNPADASFQEYMVLTVQLKNGDKVQLYDKDNKAAWAVNLDGASVQTITKAGSDYYTCTADGCYDFYIKLKMNQDQLYVGQSQSCTNPAKPEAIGGSDTPNPPAGTGEGNPRYYYKGHIDGEDNEPSEATLFKGGMANLKVYEHAYIFVIYQVDGAAGVQYMTASYVDGPSHCTLLTTGNEKFHLGPGDHKLYLYDNGNGTLELSTEPLAGKTLVNPGSALTDVAATIKAEKCIINGQVVILRGNKHYNLLGAEIK